MAIKLKIICTVGSCDKIQELLNNDNWLVKKNKPYYYDYIVEKEISESNADLFAKDFMKKYSNDIVDIVPLPPNLNM